MSLAAGLPTTYAGGMRHFAWNRLPFIRPAALALVLVASAPTAEAQPTCSLPVSAYLTDDAGAPLDGALTLELEFFLEADPGAPPAECRTFDRVPVMDGWVRIDVDACAVPAAGDCGVAPITEALRDADGLWVSIRADGTELGPRIAVGAVPYAVEASNAAALQGHGPDAFEAAGAIEAHADDADAHHSSTSDGLHLTPASVEIGETTVESGRVDLGPDASDALTAEIVETLTGGGEADALHGHASSGTGGGGCYVAVGTTSCAEGYALAYSGIYGDSMAIYPGTGIAATSVCVADEAVVGLTAVGGSPSRLLYSSGGTASQRIDIVGTHLVCAMCCP